MRRCNKKLFNLYFVCCTGGYIHLSLYTCHTFIFYFKHFYRANQVHWGFFSSQVFVCVSNLGFKMFYTCGPNEAMVVSGNGLIIVSVNNT